MDLKRARRLFAANRMLLLVVPFSILLLASLGLNIWHHQVDQKRRAGRRD